MRKNIEFSNIVYLVLSFITIVFAIILLLTNILYKKKLLKSEILLCERYFVLIIFNLYYIISKLDSLSHNSVSNNNFIIVLFIFLIIYYVNILAVNRQIFKEINYPFYNFISIFNNKWKNIFWEGLTLFFIIIGILLQKYFDKENSARDSEIQFQLILRPNQISTISILSFINIIYFISCIINCSILSNFQNKSKKQMFLINFFNFIFSVIQMGYTSIIFISFFIPVKSTFNSICTYYLLSLIILDMIINMILIRNSDFYFYTLGNKCLASFYFLYGCNDFYKPVIQISDEENNTINHVLLSSNEEIIKKDNILYYFHNNLYFTNISQFNLEISEYCLNLSISCICSIFEKIKEQLISKNDIIIQVNNNNWKNNLDKKGKYYEFTFNESSFKDNEKAFITKLQINSFDQNVKYNDKFEVNVKYFHFDSFLSIIQNKNINLSELIKSLLSHSCKYPFLLCKNSKNEYFKSMKTLSLKTNDRKYIIEIFSNVLNDDSNNVILEQYLSYISNRQTFLPTLIGAFKIKINKMKPFTIFISRNSIMENVPKEIFTYWQLMRYIPKKEIFEKISTSKDRSSICITEDNLFTSSQKITLKDYLNFSSIITEDVNFLSNIGTKNFSLLIMYYEFDQNNQNVEEYLIMSRSNSKIIKNDLESSNKKFDEGNIDFRISEIKNMKEDELTQTNLDFTICNANIDGNGFESKFNGVKSMIYFSFEKIFEFRGYSFSTFDYNFFIRKIIDYFDSNFEE